MLKKIALIIMGLLALYSVWIRFFNEDKYIPKLGKINIMIPWMNSPEHAFLYYGEKAYRLNIRDSRGSHQVAEAFRKGDVNFGFISADTLIMARQTGIQLKALFVIYPETPTVIVSLKESNITSLKQLKGKSVGVIKTSVTYPQFQRVLSLGGLESNDIKEINARYGGVAQLKNKEFDALIQYEHFAPIQLSVKGIETNYIPLKKYLHTYSTVFAASDKILRENPKLVEEVVNILLNNLEKTMKDPLAAIKKMKDKVGTEIGSDEYIEKGLYVALKMINENENRFGCMSKSKWAETEDQLMKTKQINKTIPLNNYYEDSFISSRCFK